MIFEFYIDFDEDPKIGGQQGVFYLEDETHTHNFDDLIGARIIGVRTIKDQRVMVFTVEK